MTPEQPLAQHLLTSQRRVMLSGALDPGVVAEACAKLMYLDGVGEDPATLLVGAGSPDLEMALPLLDTLSVMRMSVTVEVMGRAHGGAGVVVAAAPGLRRIGPSASISLRLDDAPVHGTAHELRQLAEHRSEQRGSVASIVALRSDASIEWVLNEFERGGILSAADAVTAGIVDELRT